MTPLHQAAKHGRAEAVRALIAAGALVESKDVSDHVPPPRPPAILKPHRALRACIGSVPFRINSTRGVVSLLSSSESFSPSSESF